MGVIKTGAFLSLTSTFYTLAGWPGACLAVALCAAGIWWVEK